MKRYLRVPKSLGTDALKRMGRIAGRLQERSAPRTDLLESEDAYLVVLDAPGATASDIQIRYETGSILVRIDRFRDHHDGYDMVYPGRGLSFDATVQLPDDAEVIPDEATAMLTDHGTLEITLPKDRASDAPESD